MVELSKSIVARLLLKMLPPQYIQELMENVALNNPELFVASLGPMLNRKPTLENMPFDLDVDDQLYFEHLSGLFASTNLNHAVVGMPIRQVAYIFGLVRQINPGKVIEIGRYKGGITFTLAAAMSGKGTLWSIDNAEKEVRITGIDSPSPFDEQIQQRLDQFHLSNVHLLVGDSLDIEVDTGDVDLVVIDGDHSYKYVKNDFERFGARTRIGGSIVFDDVYDDGFFPNDSDDVLRVVEEALSSGAYKFIQRVDRLAHLERIK